MARFSATGKILQNIIWTIEDRPGVQQRVDVENVVVGSGRRPAQIARCERLREQVTDKLFLDDLVDLVKTYLAESSPYTPGRHKAASCVDGPRLARVFS